MQTTSLPTQDKKTRVLCVDDSTDLTMMLGALLSMQKDLESAGSLENALSLATEARSRTADLVVIDLNMPGAPIDAIRDLRKCLPACRVVLYSGDHDMTHSGAAARYGVDGCVSKGTHPSDLLSEIRRVMMRRPANAV